MLGNFPGFLGYGGIIAIHADWPNYPSGIGWKNALRELGYFPKGTTFYQIDDIDRCKLLINQNPANLQNPTDYKYYHIALWHKDLLELEELGLVDGVKGVSDYEFEVIQHEEMKRNLGELLKEDDEGNIILYTKIDNGAYREVKIPKPIPDEEFEEILADKTCAHILGRISISEKGLEMLAEISKDCYYAERLNNLIQPFIKLGRYDTAIREASLLVETSIKEFHEVQLFGQKLIEFHINEVVKHNESNFSAAIKCYRGELRTIFKFIRNDFAHNFKVLTEEQCRVILFRINAAFLEFEEVVQVYFKNPSTE